MYSLLKCLVLQILILIIFQFDCFQKGQCLKFEAVIMEYEPEFWKQLICITSAGDYRYIEMQTLHISL